MVTPHIHEVALRLRNEPQFAPFKEWLLTEKAKLVEYLIASDDRVTKVLQGQAQMLNKVIDLIEGAPAVLEKRRGQK